MDGNLANAGAAEGGTMEGADRRGESCQSQTQSSSRRRTFFLFNLNYKKNSCHDSKRSEWFIKSRAVAQAFYEGRTRRVRPTNVGAVEGSKQEVCDRSGESCQSQSLFTKLQSCSSFIFINIKQPPHFVITKGRKPIIRIS